MQDETYECDFGDILLPNDSIGKKLKALRRTTLSIPNRLRSIAEDAEFVQDVKAAYGLPLVANERCGSWYVQPKQRAASAYFKSTDGHMGQWAISSRRLNLHVLEVIANHRGCIIVDSTRRGKSMPDALSKTVPIWCAVMNHLLFPQHAAANSLYTPPNCVSPSEHQLIEQRLGGFTKQLQALELDLVALRTKLSMPLRPIWVTRESTLPFDRPQFDDFYPIVLCTASRRATEGDLAADGYIQGAGDDSEGWSHGLTANLYWQHRDALLRADEEQVLPLIDSLLAEECSCNESVAPAALIEPTAWLFVGQDRAPPESVINGGFILHCGLVPSVELQTLLKERYIHLHCRDGKLGSRDLRHQLPKLDNLPFVANEVPVLACCGAESDLAIGIALAVLCMRDAHTEKRTVDKDFIRQRLGRISTSLPEARPARTTLQSVNDFLMSFGDDRRSMNQVPEKRQARQERW